MDHTRLIGAGLGTTSRVVGHGVSEKMTFKPRSQGEKGTAPWRAGGRAYWAEKQKPWSRISLYSRGRERKVGLAGV